MLDLQVGARVRWRERSAARDERSCGEAGMFEVRGGFEEGSRCQNHV